MRPLSAHVAAAFVAAFAAAACGAGEIAPAAPSSITRAPAAPSQRKTIEQLVVKGLDNPWGLAFLPGGEAIVNEMPGRMRIISKDGQISAPIANVPKVAHNGQGGLLDLQTAPDFAQSQLLYFTFSEPRGGKLNSTSVGRGKLVRDAKGARLDNVEIIFRQNPAKVSDLHFGSRIVFAPDGSLFVTLGERAHFSDEAQDPSGDLGKVIRIMPDGKPYPGNPNKPGWAPEIWSIGHRNVQGADLHPQTGKLWTVEHGARGGDEINIPEAGRNYGWPVISYGKNYDGSKIGEGASKSGMEQPVYYWDPSIAPSSGIFYTGDKFPEWRGNFFVGALKGQALHRLVLDRDKIVGEEVLFRAKNERIRNVRQGPDGYLWLVIDNPGPWGKIVRIVPAPAKKS
ncbi:MAG: PQQ-dependent sugar dehydrogenase [Caulobacterales bacterium]